jgi:photosystem II stability/assembly factor-like uncharacterized protein
MGKFIGPAQTISRGGFFGGATAAPPPPWILRASSFGATAINAVAYNGANLFVSVGAAGKIATSPDGITWTQRANPFLGTDFLQCVTFGNGLWVAGATGPKLATSPDGINWTLRALPANAGGTDVFVVAYGGGVYFAASENGAVSGAAGQGNYWTSANGTLWTARSTYVNGGFSSVVFDGADFVAGVLDFTTTNAGISFSADGINWTQNIPAGFAFSFIEGLIYNGANLYIAADTENPAKAQKSPTRAWAGTAINVGLTGQCYGGAFGNATYILVGQSGTVSSSADGTTWTVENSNFGANNIKGVAFGNGRFVAVGAAGQLATRG